MSDVDVLEYFNDRQSLMVAAIQRLALVESPSSDIASLDRCAVVLEEYLKEMLIDAEITWHREPTDGRPHLEVTLGDRVDALLIGHFDTVHPIGTLVRNPIRVDGPRLYGPGVLDMKSGVVIMVEVVRYLQQFDKRPNITLFFNSDEEIGSWSSGPLLRRAAVGGRIALAFESTAHEGLLKVGARGVRQFKVTVTGRGGHAAYPEHNVNPVDALAEVIIAARKHHNPPEGIVVVPTQLAGSNSVNTVPHSASVWFDVRGVSEAKLDEAELSLRRIRVADERIDVSVELVNSIQTFEVREDNRAFEYACRASSQLGLPDPVGVEARGASDTNQIAGIIPHAIEGLGGWGDGLHSTESEHIMLASLAPSAAISALATQFALRDE